MKKVFIGTIVGSIIYFAYLSIMWTSGLHNNFTSYSGRQYQIMPFLSQNLSYDGLYMMPYPDPAAADKRKEHEKIRNENVDKPWAMVFYHSHMQSMEAGHILMGLFYTLIACLIASFVLYYTGFKSYWIRFGIAMAFALFTLSQGVLDNMTWWSFPWSFVKMKVLDLTLGWGICSLWLAWYVKKPLAII